MMVWVGGGEGSACSPSCGTHGSCNENTRKCDCDTGYGGDDCSLRSFSSNEMRVITNNSPIKKKG